MQAIVYRRYSSDEQGDGSAQTLDAQLERCQSFAKAQGSYATAIGMWKSIISLILVFGANKLSKKIRGTALF